jgi:hypothetical protein
MHAEIKFWPFIHAQKVYFQNLDPEVYLSDISIIMELCLRETGLKRMGRISLFRVGFRREQF